METQYPISEEQVRFYEENGYIQLLDVLTPGELEQVRAAWDVVMAVQLDYAGPNAIDKPRRAIITIYMPDEVHFTGAKHVVTEDLNLRVGDVLAGERFPVLAEKQE